QVLEDVELSGAVPELGLEAVERAQDAAQVELIGIGEQLLWTAEGRGRREVELAVVEAGHRRQPRAERVEAHDVRVHLPEPERERVDALLKPAPGSLEHRLLRLELGAPGLDLGAGIRETERVGRTPADEERGREQRQRQGGRGGPDPAGLQSEMSDLAAV